MGSASGVQGKKLSQVTHPISKKEICVPIESRGLNEVDCLTDKIKLIQENCSHDWRLTEPLYLRESLVEGVFILYDASTDRHKAKSVLRCQECSKEKEFNFRETCPHCLGEMREGAKAGMREFYFGRDYLYYGAFPYYCVKCGFKGVVDAWDQ